MKLSIHRVAKCYAHDVWALNDFQLDIGPGILGLLGPNGAGKSTLMRILATITRPTRGHVTWDGIELATYPDRLRTVLGYLPQDFGVYPNLNAIEFLEYLAAIRGVDRRTTRQRIPALLELFNLTDVCRRPLGGYSGGMKQRVGIAQALLNDPRLLIVDEPTAGLDPEERVRIRNLLSELSSQRVVILSTHIVSDVEAVAANLAIMAKGRLLIHGSLDALLQPVVGKVWETVVASAQLEEARKNRLVSGCTRRADGVRLRIVAEASPGPGAEQVFPTLEDAYLYYLADQRESTPASAGTGSIPPQPRRDEDSTAHSLSAASNSR